MHPSYYTTETMHCDDGWVAIAVGHYRNGQSAEFPVSEPTPNQATMQMVVFPTKRIATIRAGRLAGRLQRNDADEMLCELEE